MIILFKGVSFENQMIGRVDYYAKVENEKGEVNVEEIRRTIESVREYVDSVLKDNSSEKCDEVEMWDAYDFINEAINRLGYSCEFVKNELNGDFNAIIPDSVENVDIKADAIIEI